MLITFTQATWDELWDESWQSAYSPENEPFVNVTTTPLEIGLGSFQSIDHLYPDVWLGIGQRNFPVPVHIAIPEAEHPLQFCFLLAGRVVDSQDGEFSRDYTMISGSGVQPNMAAQMLGDQRLGFVEIVMPPERLATFFPDVSGQLPAELSFLAKGGDWQTLLYPKSNGVIQRVVRQIVYCPYTGNTKRLYLQTKVTELLGLQLTTVLLDRGGGLPRSGLKPRTIAQIYAAKDLLLANLANPLSSVELAQQVGISDRTLRRGFRELFNTTIFNYVSDRRLAQAEQLLRERHRTVAEVAVQMGYSNAAHFAAAFKRKFGITPTDCMVGKSGLR